MTPPAQALPPGRPVLAWATAALAGFAAPVLAMLALADPQPLAAAGSPILALGLMGTAMITAAVAGRVQVGVLLALLNGAGLLLLAQALGLPPPAEPLWTGLAVLLASVSFAARGALFARSTGSKGWLIAAFVVAGEAAVLLTAATRPGVLPDWLLALLPAQWASVALGAGLGGKGIEPVSAALIALAGTAAATMLVARLWPRRWPYLIMFTTWLALSALVWHSPAWPIWAGLLQRFWR